MASSRRRPPALRAVLIASVGAVAALSCAGGSAAPVAEKREVAPVVQPAVPCCVQIVEASQAAYGSASQLLSTAAPAQMVAASRWRVINVPQLLPAGIAPERGLQIKTILVARSISVVFPEIHSIGGVRPDALRWHPDGLALDVMIPNPSSSEGIQLGNEIVAYALKNADRFDLQDAIWRGVYYTPEGPQSSGAGHFDHVHLTTRGGGYPTGSELYYR